MYAVLFRIHVRRTDKVGTEAAFHGVEEYMRHVDNWFSLQERIPGQIDKRRVYLASDDPNVLPEARQKFVAATLLAILIVMCVFIAVSFIKPLTFVYLSYLVDIRCMSFTETPRLPSRPACLAGIRINL